MRGRRSKQNRYLGRLWVQPTKLVHGRGLCLAAAFGNLIDGRTVQITRLENFRTAFLPDAIEMAATGYLTTHACRVTQSLDELVKLVVSYDLTPKLEVTISSWTLSARPVTSPR